MKHFSLVWALILSVLVGLVFGLFMTRPAMQRSAFTVEVAGELGAPVAVTASGTLEKVTSAPVVEVKGSGRTVVEGGQLRYRAQSFSYTPGFEVVDNASEVNFAGVADSSTLKSLSSAIVGQQEGARLIVTKVSEGATSAEIVVVDVLPTLLVGAMTQPPTGSDLPQVRVNDVGMPSLEFKSSESTEVQSQVLIQGNGVQVKQSDTILANYIVVDEDGSNAENTWEHTEPARIDLEQAMPGLQQAVVDQKLGTRLLVSIPPALAQGNQQVVVLIDILGLVQSDTRGN